MKTLRNFTLHPQGDLEAQVAAASGFELRRPPEGVEVGKGQAGLDAAAAQLAELLEDCAGAGDAGLAGGHTGLWVVATAAAVRAGKPLPPLYCFETRRIHDSQGRFVFQPEGLLRLC